MLSIIGARVPKNSRCNPKKILSAIEEFSKKTGCAVQVLDASMIVGREHLYSAVLHAQRAFDEKRNAARSISVEVARYASGERQISVALSKMGISEKTKAMAIIAIGNCDLGSLVSVLGLERDDCVLDATPQKLKKWKIKEKKEILERIAMVDVL